MKTASEMTYTVSGGALNSTQSNPTFSPASAHPYYIVKYFSGILAIICAAVAVIRSGWNTVGNSEI